jgi:hypothetical protein
MAVTLIVIHFHDRFWWPPDDGAYAYVAWRLLNGDVLNGDIQDIHAGYVHFIHAAALKIFGEDMLSLRYPLALLTVLQAAIVYRLLLSKGVLAAFSGAMAAGSLTFVQFVNPSANWYVLFAAFAVIACIKGLQPESARRYIAIGFLLTFAVLLRQLSGIFLAMGTIAWLLIETTPENKTRSWLAKASLLIFATGLIFYFLSKGSVAAFLMFGVWPLGALAVMWRHVSIGDRKVLNIYRALALGGSLAGLPLLAYHMFHGTLASWFDDVVLAALHLNGLSFVSQPSFGVFFIQILGLTQSQPSIAGILSSAYWLVLLCLPVVTGVVLWRRGWKGLKPSAWEPATVIALFFAPVSAHYQIPIYLTYTSGLTLVGLLSLARNRREAIAPAAMSMALVAVGLILHAGQPLSRGIEGIIRGRTVTLNAPTGIARASIAMERSDADIYGEIVAAIERHSGPDERIFALPFIPEFYFLSRRQAAFRFLGLPFGIHDEAELSVAIGQMSANPPSVIVNRRVDKYHSPLSIEMMREIERSYGLLKSVGDFDIYVPASQRSVDGYVP